MIEHIKWRLVRAGEIGPVEGGHGSWVETDHPAVVACMGSVPACAEFGCQYRRLLAGVEKLRDEWAANSLNTMFTDEARLRYAQRAGDLAVLLEKQ